MGLLGSLLTVGGTAVGAAFGMPQVGAAVGGALGGAVESSKGSKKATKEQLAAQAEARRVQGEAYGDVKRIQDPYLNLGTSSVNALSGRLGLPGAPGTMPGNALTTGGPVAGQPAPYGAGAPPGAAYSMAPGSAFDPRKAPQNADRPILGYEPSGKIIYGDPPTAGANPLAPGATASKAAGGFAGTSPIEPDFSGYPGGDTFVDPRTGLAPGQGGPDPYADQPQGPTNALTGAPAMDPGTYGSPTNPNAPQRYQSQQGPEAYKAPEAFEFDVDAAMQSPILQAAIARSGKAVQSSAAAQGSLYSGNTLKEINDRAMETTYGFLNSERAFASGRHDNERGFGYGLSRDGRSDFVTDRGFDYGLNRDDRSDYQDDRGYLTNRFDTQTNNLFRGVGIGQGAAGTVSNAASRYGDQVAGLVTAGGEAKAANALTQGQIGSDFATGLGGIIGGAFPAGGVSKNALQPPPGYVNFLNTPASLPANLRF